MQTIAREDNKWLGSNIFYHYAIQKYPHSDFKETWWYIVVGRNMIKIQTMQELNFIKIIENESIPFRYYFALSVIDE